MRTRPTLTLLLLASCASPPPPESAVPDGGGGEPTSVEVSAGDDAPLFTAPARLLPGPGASALVSFLAEGTVRAVAARPGDSVEAGDVLVRVASPELARLAGTRASAVRRLAIATDRLERLEALAAEQIASVDAVEARRAEIAALRSEAASARGELEAFGVARRDLRRLARTGVVDVRSPVGGLIRRLEVEVGEHVGGAEPALGEIVGEGPARVEALLSAPPRPGLRFEFRGSGGERYPVGEAISSLPDPDTGSWRVWFELSTPTLVAGPRIGELAAFADAEELVTFPRRALGQHQGARFVLRRQNGKTERVPVELLHLSDDRAVVKGSLRAGDLLVPYPRSESTAEGG